MSLENNLVKATSICNGEFIYYEKYSTMYTFTTENIADYLKYFDFKNKKILTVGSSCDQVLNLAYIGASDITLYDINEYAKYYFYLKISAIISLDYLEFQQFFFKHGYDFGEEEYYNKKMFSKNIFDKLKMTLRLLDYESYLFFDELFCLFSPEEIRKYLFDDDEDRNKVIREYNLYLKDEESYNKMKSMVYKINFNYVNGNIFEDKIDGKFDNILLSNLCTTVNTLDSFKEILDRLSIENLNSDGSILLGYLWNTDYFSTNYENSWIEAYKIPIVKEKIGDFITEYHEIKDYHSIVHNYNSKKDLVLIYRK